ncbi:ribonuclease H-like domain-containing protein [Lentinula edodes]|nr:ribonuclease H-like domain-containing protein [Lentinula edodes]
MARSFMQVLDEYGIADRIGQITLDNASNNNTMICFPHVINIAVKTGLSFVTTLPPLQNGQTDDDGLSADEISAVLFDNPNNSEEYQNALASDLISRVRHLVNLCRASGNRRDDFRNTVLSMREEIRNARIERSQEREGNSVDDKSDYSDTTMLLERVVVLLRDVDTRWSSTFFMVDRFLELYPAIRQFVQNDPKICDTELFSPVELQVLDDIREYLFAFHSIQELASAEKTPTLSIVLPLYEGLIEILGLMKSTLPNLSHVIDVSLEKLREYTNKARVTRIYGLAMAINPTTKLDWVSDNWLRSEKDQVRNWLKNAMLEYRRTISSTTSLPTSVLFHQLHVLKVQLKKSFARTASLSSVNSASSSQESTGSTPSDDMLVEDEFRNWLDAGTLNDPEELSNFDIVRFWDLASAVPCERAFSSGKETNTLRRSRLSSEMMEVLQFLKHVYHSDRLNFTNSWIAQVHEEVDRGTMLNIDSSMIHSMLASGKIRDLCQLMESS